MAETGTPSQTIVREVREEMAVYRDPEAPILAQLRAQDHAHTKALRFIADMGHADVITARRLAALLLP